MDESGFGVVVRTLRPATAGIGRLAFAVLLTLGGLTGIANADQQVVDGTLAPIVHVNVREGDVTVRTWERNAVAVEGDPSLTVQRRVSQQSGQTPPLPIPEMSRDDGSATLPPETFVTSAFPSGPRDVVTVKSGALTPRGPVTVMVPSNAVFVYARAASGRLDVVDYRGGTLVAIARTGAMNLTDVGGTVFAQTFRGPIVVRASNVDRIRTRSLFGNVTFERCNVRQIEATTFAGSIVYDGGSFASGLARFESIRGNVAIGASGNVQYGAHASGDGRVYTNFAGRVQVDARNGQTNAVVGDGGPVVTATTQGGSIFLYDGSLRNRGGLPPEWQPAVETLQRPGTPGQPAPLGARRQRFVPSPAFRRFNHFR